MTASTWRGAVRITALLSYLTSLLFIGLAFEQFRGASGSSTAGIMDTLVAIYFTLQWMFLYVLDRLRKTRLA